MPKETIIMGIVTLLGIDRRKHRADYPQSLERREPNVKEARKMYHDAIEEFSKTVITTREKMLKK